MDQISKAVDLGLMDCIGCGSCSYVSPSHIPLSLYFNYAKGHLRATQAKQRKAKEAAGAQGSEDAP